MDQHLVQAALFDTKLLLLLLNNEQLMNEAEYLMNNYGDRGGCYRADNTFRDLPNSSYDTKAEFNNVLLFI